MGSTDILQSTFEKNHSDLISYNLFNSYVGIIGLGHATSKIGANLARLGVSAFMLYDPDSVEAKNIPGSLYERRQINDFKVIAYRDLLLRVNPNIYTYVDVSYVYSTTTLVPANLYIIGTDTITSRINIAKAFVLTMKFCFKKFTDEFYTWVIDVRFKYENFVGVAFKLTKKNYVEQLEKYFYEIRSIPDTDDENQCTNRSNPLLVSMASVVVPKIVIDIFKDTLKDEYYYFGGDYNNLSMQIY